MPRRGPGIDLAGAERSEARRRIRRNLVSLTEQMEEAERTAPLSTPVEIQVTENHIARMEQARPFGGISIEVMGDDRYRVRILHFEQLYTSIISGDDLRRLFIDGRSKYERRARSLTGAPDVVVQWGRANIVPRMLIGKGEQSMAMTTYDSIRRWQEIVEELGRLDS